MNPKNKQRNTFVGAMLLALLGFACKPENPANVSSENAPNIATNQAVKKPLSDFEEKLNYVRNGRFTYIYAFTRKDGKPFDGETKDYVRTFSAPQTNQWVITEDEKIVVAGSNFKFQSVNFEALLKMFKIEDFSDTETGTSGVEITKIPKAEQPSANANKQEGKSKK